jgi:hypothetical protein
MSFYFFRFKNNLGGKFRKYCVLNIHSLEVARGLKFEIKVKWIELLLCVFFRFIWIWIINLWNLIFGFYVLVFNYWNRIGFLKKYQASPSILKTLVWIIGFLKKYQASPSILNTPSYTNKHNVSLQYIVQFSKLLSKIWSIFTNCFWIQISKFRIFSNLSGNFDTKL